MLGQVTSGCSGIPAKSTQPKRADVSGGDGNTRSNRDVQTHVSGVLYIRQIEDVPGDPLSVLTKRTRTSCIHEEKTTREQNVRLVQHGHRKQGPTSIDV